MPKEPRIRTLMESQHVKGSETLLKSARHIFFEIFWSLWNSFSAINAFLEVSEILRLFVGKVNLDNKYILSAKASV